MSESFNSKYESRHERLQGDVNLVRCLFERARGFSEWADWYETTGLKCDGIYLGLDPQEGHTLRFEDILAKMRIIHDLREEKIDLSRIYALLVDEKERRLAIVSEDMSKNGVYSVEDRAPGARITKILSEVFYDANGYEQGIDKMVFRIVNKTGRVIRSPVVDFDHVKVRRQYDFDLYKKYVGEYHATPKFRIHLV